MKTTMSIKNERKVYQRIVKSLVNPKLSRNNSNNFVSVKLPQITINK